MKKILKWSVLILGVVMLILVATPFLFKEKIKEMVIGAINDNVDATVDFEEVDLSFLRNFPMASVSVKKLSVINKEPFLGDTLVYSERIDLKMSIKELFKSEGEAMNLAGFSLKNTRVNVIFNAEGIGNFDIALKNDTTDTDNNIKTPDTSESSAFSMKIQSYSVDNLKVSYIDRASNMKAVLDKINHKGTGDFNNSVVDLDTYTTAKVLFEMDGTNYLNNVDLILDAVLNLDLEQSKYTFKENMLRINNLPLEFDGFVQIFEYGQEFDLTFNTPTTSFSNFLGLIPSAYSGSLENVKTTGDFSVKGFAKGTLTEENIPKFNISMASDNASFQYPDLPKKVQNIVIDAKVGNQTGNLKDTYVDLDKLSFKIDQDVFHASAKLRNVTENMIVDAKMDGSVNLAHLSRAYPIDLEQDLKGIIKAYLALNLDMLSIEQEKYENVNAEGSFSLMGFEYSGEELAKPLVISQVDLTFNPSHVALNTFKAKTGKSDIRASGNLDNFYGFIFKDQVLKGNFSLISDHLEISDFMTASTEETPTSSAENSQETSTETTEPVKIPAFLDCLISAKANTVVYDNLTLKDVSGKLRIKDETVSLENVITSIFGGKIGMDGSVSTKGEKPLFDMSLNLDNLDIGQSFTQLDMLGKIAPIAQVVSGKFTSAINLVGALNPKEFTPDLNSLRGDLLGQLLETKVNKNESKLLSSLEDNLGFVDLDKLNLNKLKAAMKFTDGQVKLEPFDLKYDDINIQVAGTHGFDQIVDYGVTFDVPAKYLGKEVTSLLANLSGNQANSMTVPIKAKITGDFSNPKIQTDMKQAIAYLTKQIVEKQKSDLINKGKDAVKNEIGNAIDKDLDIPTSKEEVKQKIEEKKEEVKEKIDEKKEEIKEKAKEEAKDKVKDKVKGLLNKKKK